MDDLSIYGELQAERWSDDSQASHDDLLSRFRTYPQGMLVAECQGVVVGMVFVMRLPDYDEAQSLSWYQITNNGRCDNHAPDGKVMFGVDLSTSREHGAAAGDKLLIAVGRLVIREGLEWSLLGGRMPGYHQRWQTMAADEYLHAKAPDGQPLDPQVRYYTSITGLRAVRAIPNYFKDPDSCNYGVLLRWRNPLYGRPGRKVWAALFPLLFKIETVLARRSGVG